MPCTVVRRFDWLDAAAVDFFREHGFVIVRGVLGDPQRALIASSFRELVTEAAARVQLTQAQFTRDFPQNRDLWRKHEAFRSLLFGGDQAAAAMRFLGVYGVRLFHDHAIAKPSGASGTIPWHQDSTYWPLDRPGLSLWTPVDEVGADGGCLKVLDGSHRDGAAAPRDFLAQGPGRDPFDDDPRLVALPVAAGETVILHGLTWHGSDPNTSGRDRLAYLTLWVPAAARFVRQNADWHPTTAHISVADGERLEGEWFPLFGVVDEEDERGVVPFQSPQVHDGPSMFTAGEDIQGQIAWLLGRPAEPLGHVLARHGAGEVAARAVALGVVDPGAEATVAELVVELGLQDQVRRESVARDVYLGAVTRWWSTVGHRIEEARRGS